MINNESNIQTNRPKCKPQNHVKPIKNAVVQPAELLKVGLDVGAEKFVFTLQYDHSLPEGTRLVKTPEQLVALLVKKRPMAKRIVVCYEAGFSGFSLARKLIEHQIECLVMAPVKLDEPNSRVSNDRLDSCRILSLLDRHLAGNPRALTPVRIPTPEEEITRADTRQLEQFKEHARAMQAQGRSLLYFLGLPVVPEWWRISAWNAIQAQLPEKVKNQLNRWRQLIEAVEKEIAALIAELHPAQAKLPAPMTALPLGLGGMTWMIIDHEVMDWQRFTHRGQPGKFCGLIPSESSTGKSVRYGSITKVGNPRIRRLLIEAVWRMVRYQPQYHALQKWGFVLGGRDGKKNGKALRKKAVVAVARLLMVDLWRLATGQTTLEKLGLIPVPIAA